MCSFIDLALFDEQNREKHPSAYSFTRRRGNRQKTTKQWMDKYLLW